MDDLITWLRAQLDEDQRVARDAAGLGAVRSQWAREFISCIVDVDGDHLAHPEEYE